MIDILKEYFDDNSFIVNNISIMTYYNSNKASISISGTNENGKVNKFISTKKDIVDGYTGKSLIKMFNERKIND